MLRDYLSAKETVSQYLVSHTCVYKLSLCCDKKSITYLFDKKPLSYLCDKKALSYFFD